MTTRFRAHFDGKVLIPDQPVDLPVGRTLYFTACTITDEQAAASPFLRLAKLAHELPEDDDSPADLASQKNHYLYGHPKEQ